MICSFFDLTHLAPIYFFCNSGFSISLYLTKGLQKLRVLDV